MKKIMFCTIVVLTSVAASLPACGENPYIGYWALILPNGGPGWLGITQEKGELEASILWGGGSVKPVNSVTVDHRNHHGDSVRRQPETRYRQNPA
jgi:hypothetical protein